MFFEKKEFLKWAQETYSEEQITAFFSYPTTHWARELPTSIIEHLKEYNLRDGVKNAAEIAQSYDFNCLTIDRKEKMIAFLERKGLYKLLLKNADDPGKFFRMMASLSGGDVFYSFDTLAKEYLSFFTKMKPGKFFQFMFPEASAQDCEEFVKTVSVYFHRLENPDIRILSGEDVVAYYNERKYISGGGPLQSSCMRGSSFGPILSFYPAIGVKMVALFDPEEDDKIRARALLWEGCTIGNKTLSLMDRIYFTKEEDLHQMIAHAEKQGWAYKKQQTADSRKNFMIPGKNEVYEEYVADASYEIEDIPFDVRETRYPYLDTFPFFYYSDMKMTNDKVGRGGEGYILRSTGGGHSEID